jgi:hypothetical protein
MYRDLLFLVVLFIVLTPGILVTFPRKGSKYTLVTHATIVGVVYYFMTNSMWRTREFAPPNSVQRMTENFVTQNCFKDSDCTTAPYIHCLGAKQEMSSVCTAGSDPISNRLPKPCSKASDCGDRGVCGTLPPQKGLCNKVSADDPAAIEARGSR